MIVSKIILPKPVPNKNSFLKEKFDIICQEVNSMKDRLEFEAKDFARYDTIFNEEQDANKPLIVFGNITLNKESVSRMYTIVSSFPKGTECIIIMLSDQKHE